MGLLDRPPGCIEWLPLHRGHGRVPWSGGDGEGDGRALVRFGAAGRDLSEHLTGRVIAGLADLVDLEALVQKLGAGDVELLTHHRRHQDLRGLRQQIRRDARAGENDRRHQRP